ncbi:unnamed protein product, partial [Didymodactylos carnosus]
SSKCPIKRYKSGKYFLGDKLDVQETMHERIKLLETLAKDCQVLVHVKGSYYQLQNPAAQVPISDSNLVIGHGFAFELRDAQDRMLCNSVCLNKNPLDIAEVKCFISGAINRGWTWSRTNPTVLSDGFYEANPSTYQKTKTQIQTDCQNVKLKRQMMLALRRLYDDETNVE